MKYCLRLFLALLLVPAFLVGQQIINSLIFRADPPPLVQGMTGSVSGTFGQVPLYYWITARYPIGVSLPVGPVRVNNTVGVAGLSGANFVALSWQPAAGATGYDVIRGTSPQFPQSGTCANCVVSSNGATTSFSDIGGGVVNWPTANTVFAPSVTLGLSLNNREQSTPFLDATGELHYRVVRSTGQYAYGFDINPGTSFFNQSGVQKSYLLSIRGDRPAGSAATGDSNDALIKATYNNYAANDGNFVIRGVNSVANNRSGGTLGLLIGGLISASSKSGSTSPIVRGLEVGVENFGTNATEHSGIDVTLKNEGAKATLEYGVRVRNINNSLGTAADAGFLVADSGANIGWNYGLDMFGATIQTADIRTSSGAEILTGTGAPAAGLCVAGNVGAIYLNHAGGANTGIYVCEGAGSWAAK